MNPPPKEQNLVRLHTAEPMPNREEREEKKKLPGQSVPAGNVLDA
jgi:hypothetical protein